MKTKTADELDQVKLIQTLDLSIRRLQAVRKISKAGKKLLPALQSYDRFIDKTAKSLETKIALKLKALQKADDPALYDLARQIAHKHSIPLSDPRTRRPPEVL